MKNKCGYHAVYSDSFFSGIDDAAENGFDFVQFELGTKRFFLNGLSGDDLKAIRSYAENKKIQITFHAPGDNVSLFCDYPLIRKGILDEFGLILEKANSLGARHVTFHLGNYSQFKKANCKTDETNLTYYEDVLHENLKHLINLSGNVQICIENFELNSAKRKALGNLIEGKNPIFLTIDTAKLYKENEIIVEDYEFFLKHKALIREMHVHDFNGEFGSHQIVGSGNVDFNLFKQFLAENVYINFEVRPVKAAKESMDKFLSITSSD